MGILNKTDVVAQISTCSFDAHVLEILGSLISSATVLMLHPYGSMDLVYLASTVHDKQVTYMLVVPSFMKELSDFIQNKSISPFSNMRSLCCGG